MHPARLPCTAHFPRNALFPSNLFPSAIVSILSTILRDYKTMYLSRKSIRLKGFDYRSSGAYFITICSTQRQDIFGCILDNGDVALSDIGHIVQLCWQQIPDHCPHVQLDHYVIMPNHLHGIIILDCDDLRFLNTFGITDASLNTRSRELSRVIGSFKAASTKIVRRERDYRSPTIWQRNYFERVIRDERELMLLRQYMADNPITLISVASRDWAVHAPPLQLKDRPVLGFRSCPLGIKALS
jgi:putative transposase